MPHFSWHNAFDEDHERFFNINAFSGMHASNLEKQEYSKIERKVKVLFYKGWRIWEYPVEWLVNLHPRITTIWESTLLVHVFPANQIYFEMKKRK